MIKILAEEWVKMSENKAYIRMGYNEKLAILADRTGNDFDEIKEIVKTDEFLESVYELGLAMDKAKFADAVSRQHQLLDSRVDMVGLEASKEIINRAMEERKEKAGKDKQSISDKLTDLLNDLK